MGIISWIILGLVVGVIAKFLMPGKDPGGLYHHYTGDCRRCRGWFYQLCHWFR